MIHRLILTAVFLCAGYSGFAQDQISGANCTFTPNPDKFLSAQIRAHRDVAGRVAKLDAFLKKAMPASMVQPQDVPQRNFIDTAIFGAMAAAKVPSAALSGDEEFLRRITLDLTGRIPSSADVRAFTADTSTGKRDAIIEKLLYSPEFLDKWTMWMGDLLQNVSSATNVAIQNPGRDVMYNYIKLSIDGNKSFRDIAYECVTAGGDTGDFNSGPSSFLYRMQTPGGPVQDSYDTSLARVGDTFLGNTYYDCVLCHNGRGHLDSINLWGGHVTRTDAESMAAFFSRLNFNMPRTNTDPNNAMYNSWRVLDRTTGSYDLTTTYGNRPNRTPVGIVKTLTPVYYGTGAAPAANQNWRESFAQQMVADPMFARNFANRLWKAFFNLGLVDPVDTMDPARLDPASPPPAPWALQAANPQLLDSLAKMAVRADFQLKDFIRLLVQSSAYQLSSRYDGDWTLDAVPLYARHYPRRMDAEEVHDAIAKATGVLGNYNVNGPAAPLIQWAMQLPDPLAPAGGGTNLLNAFVRGNRDTAQRSSAASILQRLTVMNDTFVTSRTKVAASPVLLAASKITDNNALIDEMFLTFVSRKPTDEERSKAIAYLAAGTTTTLRNNAIEDLAWALINKIDFLYSY